MKKEKNIAINYIFFFVFLGISLILNTFQISNLNQSFFSKIFFLIYAYIENFFIFFVLINISFLIKKYFKKIFFDIFIGIFFIFVLINIIDYILVKYVDLNFYEGLDLILDESLENFIEMLHATSIPFFLWIIFGIFTLALPFIGIYLYKLSEKILKKMKFTKFKINNIFQITFCFFAALLIWDYNIFTSMKPITYLEFSNVLPLKFTIFKPKDMLTKNMYCLKKSKNEKKVLKAIDQDYSKIEKKPNIFIFVIESLRSDYITEDIANNLNNFKKENINFKKSLSNSNCTPHSWFSLFHSEFSHLWKHYKDKKWSSGSIPLNILKKMGYKINVFSSPELKYYSMKDLLFGKDNNLINSLNIYPHYYPIEACDSDILVFSNIEKTLEKDRTIYISFLDSTHFLYSWPKDFKTKFLPYADIKSINAMNKDEIYLLKNRYKNSINFLDTLFGSFFDMLKQKNIFEDSIIIIAADHGEEFYEEGKLFHASHLSNMQTDIPIFLKFGKNLKKPFNQNLISQMDIFPSILEYLLGKNMFENILSGKSIFSENENKNFVITSRFNGARSPYEFFIYNENEKLTLRFTKKKSIFKKQNLQILSVKDENDKIIEKPLENLKKFEKIFEKLFKIKK